MSATYQCDGCSVITRHVTLRIERVDGLGSIGDRRYPTDDQPWDLCNACSGRLVEMIKNLRSES